MEQGRPWSPRQRLALALVLACVVHGLVLMLVAPPSLDPSARRPPAGIAVRLVEPAPAPPPERPERVRSEAPPPPVPVEVEDRSHRAREVARVREPVPVVPEREPGESNPAPATAPPAVSEEQRRRARAVLGQLGRFRLDTGEPPALPEATVEAPPRERALGQALPEETMAMLLDHDEIPLPSGETELDLRFYSGGVRGDLQRFGDAVTKTFEFKTPGGTEVQCAWVVVIFACGW